MIQNKNFLALSARKNRQLIFRRFSMAHHQLKRKKLLGSVVREANKDQRDL